MFVGKARSKQWSGASERLERLARDKHGSFTPIKCLLLGPGVDAA